MLVYVLIEPNEGCSTMRTCIICRKRRTCRTYLDILIRKIDDHEYYVDGLGEDKSKWYKHPIYFKSEPVFLFYEDLETYIAGEW